ncbi:hypothetical protein XENORESO_000279 [Xenotaenia resolanae]|uniref:Uncharacterized protein n=1 Tax=Xenotaenia resolanae TaxID=208358 RepID=A0ABV0X470_9TELE
MFPSASIQNEKKLYFFCGTNAATIMLQAQQHTLLLFLRYRMRKHEEITIPPSFINKGGNLHVDMGHTCAVTSVCHNQNNMIRTSGLTIGITLPLQFHSN